MLYIMCKSRNINLLRQVGSLPEKKTLYQYYMSNKENKTHNSLISSKPLPTRLEQTALLAYMIYFRVQYSHT
jgi:hypothetical protein